MNDFIKSLAESLKTENCKESVVNAVCNLTSEVVAKSDIISALLSDYPKSKELWLSNIK